MSRVGHYFVGKERIEVKTSHEAIEVAVGLLGQKTLGERVLIYRSKKLRAEVFSKVQVMYDRESASFRYVYFSRENKYGRTINTDFTLDTKKDWFNVLYNG